MTEKAPILWGLALCGVINYNYSIMSAKTGIFDWVVVVSEDHEYRIEAPTRWKAINIAVNLYKEETGDPEQVAVLMVTTHGCYKIGRERRKVVHA